MANHNPDTTTQTAERCYILVFPNGEEYDNGEGTPHFSTEERAREQAPEAAKHIDFGESRLTGPPEPKLLDAPCAVIACAECEYAFDEDEVYTVHFGSREEGLKAVADVADWTVEGDRALCPECSCERQDGDRS